MSVTETVALLEEKMAELRAETDAALRDLAAGESLVKRANRAEKERDEARNERDEVRKEILLIVELAEVFSKVAKMRAGHTAGCDWVTGRFSSCNCHQSEYLLAIAAFDAALEAYKP